ncbi:hypothetical protein ACRAWF_20575 [Streptomyces sp. L7]
MGTNCPLGADERPTTGSELVADAMTSWQAKLCAAGKVYSYTEFGEPDTRSRLIADGSTGLAFTTRRLGADTGTTAPSGTTTYAPVALSGAVIGFTIERRSSSGAPASEEKLDGTKIESIKLNARLVAKLLTESYRSSTWGSVISSTAVKGYGWARKNPSGLATDPEFIALNPEFAYSVGRRDPGHRHRICLTLARPLRHRPCDLAVDPRRPGRPAVPLRCPRRRRHAGQPVLQHQRGPEPDRHRLRPVEHRRLPEERPVVHDPAGLERARDEQAVHDRLPPLCGGHARRRPARPPRGHPLEVHLGPAGHPAGVQELPARRSSVRASSSPITDAASAARYGLQTSPTEEQRGQVRRPDRSRPDRGGRDLPRAPASPRSRPRTPRRRARIR